MRVFPPHSKVFPRKSKGAKIIFCGVVFAPFAFLGHG